MKIECPKTGSMDGFDERQAILEAILKACESVGGCAECTATAALFASALIAVKDIGADLEEFLSKAESVYKSVTCQTRDRVFH